MSEDLKLARQWAAKAANDLLSADNNLRAKDVPFDVVCFHSVVVFIPMFIGWAVLLRRYAFSPAAVFVLFGISGVLAETLYGGGQALFDMGLWVFVYGLMVYLPAYILPVRATARSPRWWHYGLAVLLPLAFAVPVALVVSVVHPVRVHFGPM